MSGMSFFSTPTVCKSKNQRGELIQQKYKYLTIVSTQAQLDIKRYLSELQELSDLGHSGQEPLVDLQSLLAVTLLHFEVLLCKGLGLVKVLVCNYCIATHHYTYNMQLY